MESVPRTAFEDHSRHPRFAPWGPRLDIPQFPRSPFSTRCASPEANRLGLVPNVRAEDRAILLLQPHLDEGSEDNLEAHR